MARLEVVPVPFDGWGREGHQSAGARVLLERGFAEAWAAAGHEVTVRDDVFVLPPPDPERAAGSGLLNEAALVAMASQLHGAVGESLRAGRTPLVLGAECSVLLGAVPALRDAEGRAGLLSIDGHEDATPLDRSPDGEGANVEVGLLLEPGDPLAPAPLRPRLPAVAPEALAILGTRDDVLRETLGVGSVGDRGVLLHHHDVVGADPEGAVREAAAHIRRAAGGWWLHVDLDVVAQDRFTAQRVPGDEDEDGGLGWEQLGVALSAAVAEPGLRGMSMVIYDPEQDPDRADADRIVSLARTVAQAMR